MSYPVIMIDYEKIYPLRRLKRFPVTDIENAIAGALNALVGVADDDVAAFAANVNLMSYSDDQEVTLEIAIQTRYDPEPEAMDEEPAAAETSEE